MDAGTALGFLNLLIVSDIRSGPPVPSFVIRYPVPCADRTCRETYVQCLQALHEQDMAKQEQQQRQRALSEAGSLGAARIAGVRSLPPSLGAGEPYGEVWVYDSKGIVLPSEENKFPK